MLKFEATSGGGGGGENRWAQKPRSWVTCESCEAAPAAFLCKADSASLCAACDAHIHSANPLARRHHRIPIPIPLDEEGLYAADDVGESASWLLIKSGDDDEVAQPRFYGGEVDEYLNLEEYKQLGSGCEDQQHRSYGFPHAPSSYGGDIIVPVNEVQHSCFQPGYGFNASISQTVSISSLDAGVVPEFASIPVAHTRPPKGTIDLFSSPRVEAPSQLDREARVLRYREKKKRRRFEKTIRYASRKAYAETRPRIKGRFAKRRNAQLQLHQILACNNCL